MPSSKDDTGYVQSLSMNNKPPAPEDIEGNLRILRNVYSHYKTPRCREPTCRASLPLPNVKDHIKTWIANARGSTPSQISGIQCLRCRKFTCIGCRKKPSLNRSSISTDVAVVNHCCNQGRLFGTWVLLCRFDEVELQLQQKSALNAAKNAGRVKEDSGTGYTRGHNPFLYKSADDPPAEIINFRQQDELTDRLMTQLFQLLTAFLPSVDSGSYSKTQSHAELWSFFRISLLLGRVTELVRNDSITDMTKRSQLYRSMLAFVTAIAKDPAFVQLLIEKRVEKKASPGLQALGEERNTKALVLNASSTGLIASLFTCANKTYQCVLQAPLSSNS